MQKNRNTITLLGENTSQPDLTVPDGACEIISNLRFHNGTWQSVGHMRPLVNIPAYDGDTLYFPHFLGIHEVEGKEHPIFSAVTSRSNCEVWFIGYFDDETGEMKNIYTIEDNIEGQIVIPHKEVSATTFGNVIIISVKGKLAHLIWDQHRYKEIAIPAPLDIKTKTFSAATNDTPFYTGSTTDTPYVKLMNANTKELAFNTTIQNKYWWGEICYLVAYRMKDGTVISPSDMRIFCSEDADTNVKSFSVALKEINSTPLYVISATKENTSKSEPTNSNRLRCAYPKLLITIPEGIDTSLIDRVAVYTTTINPIIDFDTLTIVTEEGRHKYMDFYANNRLPEQPMYLAAEIEIDNIVDRKWEVELTYNVLELVMNKTKYIAPQVHTLFGESLYDYNNRLHISDITTTLYRPQSTLIPNASESGVYNAFVELGNYGSIYSEKITSPTYSSSTEEENYYIVPPQSSYVKMPTPIITYPDYRATSIAIIYKGRDGDDNTSEVKILTPALANNVAYYITPSTHLLKYPVEEIRIELGCTAKNEYPTFKESNRIQVTAANNPLSYPFANSYKVGNEGTSIVAINSVADTLVESNFYGAFPLYIFTSDGIFALAAGTGEILYGSTEIVNHDITNNPKTIAVNGAVIYACTEGLKALSGRTAVLLSEAIDMRNGEKRSWNNATFGVNRMFNELVVDVEGEIHLLDLDTKAWSSRGFSNGNFVGTHIVGDIYAAESEDTNCTELYSINREDAISKSNPVTIGIVSRPIKFGTQGFKKLSSLVARWQASEAPNLTFTIDGSNDCKTWTTFKQGKVTTTQEFGFRGIGPSARFFRVRFSGNVHSFCTLLHLDTETIDKYNYQLR